MESNDAGGRDATRFGGAAADFITSLGRKAAELRPAMDALAQDPSHRVREELRRKLHALGAPAPASSTSGAGAGHRRGDTRARRGRLASNKLSRGLVAELQTLVDRLPELAWQKGNTLDMPPVAEATPEPVDRAASIAAPWTVLVVGDEPLALALEDDPRRSPATSSGRSISGTVVDLARASRPTLVLLDVDHEGGFDLVASFADDPLTGPVPDRRGRHADRPAILATSCRAPDGPGGGAGAREAGRRR